MNKLLLGLDLIKSMGVKPIGFRIMHTLKKKTGILKKSFPASYPEKDFITLQAWQKNAAPFFFKSRESLGNFLLDEQGRADLKQEFEKIQEGYLKFFNGNYHSLGKHYDWVTNPENGYKFDIRKHWTELETLDEKQGDIKLVWEKSRFCYLYTLIRYDHHFSQDQASFVFSEILSWIDHNPVNMGPNFSCSQEISLRIFNWTFALYYYRHSPHLTESIFRKIINSVYQQALHVEQHIKFSLLTVRNNHAITESLLLYTIGLLFPFYEESTQWKEKGKKLLEQEGLYQIYEDGSYIQFSMNYERVVLQLYTWAFYLSKANNESFSRALCERVEKACFFLYQSQDTYTGMLPNYGANDGALFFPLNNCAFRDYRPQLNSLYCFLKGKTLDGPGPWMEDLFWFSGKTDAEKVMLRKTPSAFPKGGYYVLRDEEKFSFIRCGSHPDRPSQADNLHLDVWYKGKNILRDAGSFKYNAAREDIRFFMGTSSHNTVMVDHYDQMYKGGRFLWFYWSESVEGRMEIHETHQLFFGKIHAYKHLGKNITHTRIVKQFSNETHWEIEDIIENTALRAKQIWNLSPGFHEEGFEISCVDRNGEKIPPFQADGFYSPTYGVKEKSERIIFNSDAHYFKTTIRRRL